jgi:RNA polymerase sigma-70 factor (sigma-E family)
VVNVQGDDDGFEDFFRAMINRAIRSASRLTGDHSRAEDAAVEAMTRAHLRWRRLRDDPHRDAWVLRVTINVAIDQARRDQRHQRPAPAPTTATAFEETATDKVWIADELGKLPRRQREAVTLRYLADYSEADVAKAMAVSAGTVKVHLHRGLKALGRDTELPAEEARPDVPA